ncbi:COP9 signalosome [Pilobolus umbonatus]|nr:COP9 signalosome [Pilobolus umbonatus]
MNEIHTLITNESYEELVKSCEITELMGATDSTIILSELYPIYLASLIITDNLQTARYVRKRVLSSQTNTPEIDAIWSVAVALITHLYPQVYQCLDQYAWSAFMIPLTAAIKNKVRNDVSAMISNTYVSIKIDQCCDYFGLPENEVLSVSDRLGWKYNPSTSIVYPSKQETSHPVKYDDMKFGQLADIVLNLEKF